MRYFAFFCTLLLTLPAFNQAMAQGVFGSKERRFHGVEGFQKWHDMRQRYHSTPNLEIMCKSPEQCARTRWTEWIKPLYNATTIQKLQSVQAYSNQSKYIVDPINWGVEDYWATPLQFFVKDGDCEDYAISKYYMLKALGIPIENMRIVVLNDTNLGIMHAVLSVMDEVGRIWILDNQIDQVIESKFIHHYIPIYSINESFWWLHTS